MTPREKGNPAVALAIHEGTTTDKGWGKRNGELRAGEKRKDRKSERGKHRAFLKWGEECGGGYQAPDKEKRAEMSASRVTEARSVRERKLCRGEELGGGGGGVPIHSGERRCHTRDRYRGEGGGGEKDKGGAATRPRRIRVSI